METANTGRFQVFDVQNETSLKGGIRGGFAGGSEIFRGFRRGHREASEEIQPNAQYSSGSSTILFTSGTRIRTM